MKKRIKGLFVMAMMLIAPTLSADLQLSRDEGMVKTEELPAVDAKVRGPKITAIHAKPIQQKQVAKSPNGVMSVNNGATKAPASHPKKSAKVVSVKNATTKGSTFYGMVGYTNNISDGAGWQKISVPDFSTTHLWNWKPADDVYAACGGGFIRNGKVYAFYSYIDSEYYLLDGGLAIRDFNTGEILDIYEFDLLDSEVLTKVVYGAAYDEENDEVYVITSNKAGTGYKLQKFNPTTYQYTDLSVNPGEDWISIAWHPGNKTLYMLEDGGTLKKYDTRSKAFNEVGSFSYNFSGYALGSMIYSPNDASFFAMIDAYYENTSGYEVDCTDALLISDTGTASYLGRTEYNDVYSMLYCPDSYIDMSAPVAPTLTSLNVEPGATSGFVTVKLPSTLGNGSAISGKVYLMMYIDDTATSTSSVANGDAGTSVTVNFDVKSEGEHKIALVPRIMGSTGYITGQSLIINQYFGHDVPAAPKNVKFTETLVTWDAVTEGARGGYIDSANITYEVSIDGVKVTPSPISQTSFAITEMPATSAVGHVASVVAIENGNRSQAGSSDKLYIDDVALNLPVYLGPDAGEMDMDQGMIDLFTIVKDPKNTEDLRGWRYDDQSEHTGGFYCLYAKEEQCTDPTHCDEWLFLPAINFPDKDKFYRLTMEVWTGGHYFSGTEIYEVALSPVPERRGTKTIIREATRVTKKDNFETSETIFEVPEAGEYYIGIHYITPPGQYRLYARNFNVELANSTSSSPAAVTDLDAEASPRGALSAVVTFKMPTTDISGESLSAGTTVTATVSTEAGEASTTGAPGAECSVTVPANQGTNLVKVITSTENGNGQLAETTVYCGVYRPSMPSTSYSISDDNMTVDFSVAIDEYNANGEWVGADDCSIIVYRRNGTNWVKVTDIGKNRTWQYSLDDATAEQGVYQFGFAAQNVVGISDEMDVVGLILGSPVDVPFGDDFLGNELKYPLFTEHLSYLPGTWGFDNPAAWDESAANSTNISLIAMWESETQLSLAKFSTLNKFNVKADLDIFFGDKMPSSIEVYASSQDVRYQKIASYDRSTANGWQHMLVNLPAEFQNKPWVELTVRVNIVGYSSYFMMDSYSVADYPTEMVTISSVNGNSRGAVGEKQILSIDLTNAGTSEVSIPAYTFDLIGDNGKIDYTAAFSPTDKIGVGATKTIEFEFTPKVSDKGNVLARFSLAGQPEEAISSVEHNYTILNAPVPVVDDLKASVNEEKTQVQLSWTKPVYTESFEAADPWEYGTQIRDFTNIDADGSKVWGISEFNYPGKSLAKGYQVFSSTATTAAGLQAHSGEHFLLAMSTTSGETDDWLISPQIVGGSEMSFWMGILDPAYPETIFVLYSTTGDNISDFKYTVDEGYICPEKTGWQKYSFTLPADAKYFALRHYGDDGYEQFGCVIDDIKYSSVNPLSTVDSYNVYCNGALIATTTEPQYLHATVVSGDPIVYYVTTNGTVNGEQVESDNSNSVWVDESTDGVSENLAAGNGSIYGAAGKVVFRGFAEGSQARVFSIDAVEVGNTIIDSESSAILVTPGVYVAVCEGKVRKVIVR